MKEKWTEYREQSLELDLHEMIAEIAHMKHEFAAKQRQTRRWN